MNEKLSLQDLVSLLAQKNNTTQKEADRFYREFFQIILEKVYDHEVVKIKDFGLFKLVLVNSRESVDVNTGEKIEIPAHFKLTFSPDKSLRNKVNLPFSQFESVILSDDVVFDIEDESENEGEDEDASVEEKPESLQINELSLDEIYEKIESSDSQSDLVNPDGTEVNNNISERGHEDVYDSNLFSELNPEDQYKHTEDESIDESISDGSIENANISSDVTHYNSEVEKEQSESADIQNELDVNNQSITPLFQPVVSEGEEVVDSNTTHALDNELSKKDEVESVKDDNLTDDAFDQALSNYEKKSVFSKIIRKLPVILIIAALAIFAIYKFAELFDVTYDYEYDMRRRRVFETVDTFPMLMSSNDTDDLSDYIVIKDSSITENVKINNDSIIKNRQPDTTSAIKRDTVQTINPVQIDTIKKDTILLPPLVENKAVVEPKIEEVKPKPKIEFIPEEVSPEGQYKISDKFYMEVVDKGRLFYETNARNKK